MDLILKGFDWIFQNILGKPEFFIGILVFVGYLLLNKGLLEAFGGFLKALVGYMILQVGSSGMNNGFTPILNALMGKFNIQAAVIDSNFGFAAANKAIESIGASLSWTMVVLLIGFIINIALVAFQRFTKVRTLYTTGHLMVKQAGFLTWMVFFAMPTFRNFNGAIIVGILIGLYWSVFSNLTVEPTERLAGERVFAVGHAQMLAIWLTDRIAPKLGKKEDSVENIKLPKSLKIFSDNVIGTCIIMLVMFGSILLVLGQETMLQYDEKAVTGVAYGIYVISKSISFAVSFIILQTGVKMLVSEITQSFDGISSRLLKGAIPAVDCVATYGFASSNTVTLGFLFGTLGQFITILALVLFGSPVLIISGFVPLFFDNATIAVYANNRGGVKPAMILPFISGVIQVLGGALGITMFGLASFGGWYGNFDFSTVWLVLGGLFKQFALVGVVICAVLMLAIPQVQYYLSKDKENYFKV